MATGGIDPPTRKGIKMKFVMLFFGGLLFVALGTVVSISVAAAMIDPAAAGAFGNLFDSLWELGKTLVGYLAALAMLGIIAAAIVHASSRTRSSRKPPHSAHGTRPGFRP